MVGTRDLARYPFLKEAAKHVADYDFGRLDDNDAVVERAASRIKTAATGSVDSSEPEDFEIEITTFLTSLILVRKIDIPALYRKFALAETRRVEYFIRQDLKAAETSADAGAGRKLVIEMLQDFFNDRWVQTQNRDEVKIDITTYLLKAGRLNDPHWRLINQAVASGWVYLHYLDGVRLVRDDLYQTILTRLKTMEVPDDAIPHIIVKAAELKRELEPRFASKTILRVITEYPPCIKHCVSMLERGSNLPHTGRLLLATYMVGIGKEVAEIVDMFRNAPDFNEKITKEQVTGIFQKQRRGQPYHVMGCNKVQLYGYCFPDKGCTDIRNPMQYRGVRQ